MVEGGHAADPTRVAVGTARGQVSIINMDLVLKEAAVGSTMGDLRRIFEAATECTMKGEHSHQVRMNECKTL